MNTADRTILRIVLPTHALVHLYELSIPLFMTVWLDEFAVTTATLGIIVTAGYAMWGLGAIPGGKLADIYGSKRLILACLAGMAGSFLLLSVAFNPIVLGAALVCWGTAASVYHPAGLAIISKRTSQRGTAFAYHGMAGNIGIGVGPLVVAVLLVVLDWRLVAALLTVPTALTLLLTAVTHFDEGAVAHATDSTAEPGFVDGSRQLFASAFLLIFLVVITYGLYLRGALTFLPEMLADFELLRPTTVLGYEAEPAHYVYTGILLVGIVGQYAGGRLTDTLADRTELGLGGALLAIAVLSIMFPPVLAVGLLPLIVLSALFGFALFMVQPFEHAVIAEHTTTDVRGLSYGYMSLGVFGVGALGTTIAGITLTYFPIPVLFTALAGIALIGVVLTSVLYTWYR